MSLPGSLPSESPHRANRIPLPARQNLRSSLMPDENSISRRGLFMKLGILFNGVVAVGLAVPIVRYVLSSLTRSRGNAYLAWVPLGHVNEFPVGETRLATFKNPV